MKQYEEQLHNEIGGKIILEQSFGNNSGIGISHGTCGENVVESLIEIGKRKETL